MMRPGPYHFYGAKKAMRPPPKRMYMWTGVKSLVHPCKYDQINGDAYMFAERYMGIFDGQSSVADPSSMSIALRLKVAQNLDERLTQNAQKFDRDTKESLQSSVGVNTPGSSMHTNKYQVSGGTDSYNSYHGKRGASQKAFDPKNNLQK